jgi:ABC-type Fe3+ transport system permease subunit
MSPTVTTTVLIFMVVGCAFGWYSQKMYQAHGDVKVAKNRLSGGRRTRWRAGVFAVALAIVIVLALRDIF